MKNFRKPLFPALLAFLLLFVSCKQYDNDTELNEFELDMRTLNSVRNQVATLTNLKKSKNFDVIKKQVIENQKLLKSNSAHSFTESEIEEARVILNQFNIITANGDFNNLTPNEVIGSIADYGYSQFLFSNDTRNFLKNGFTTAINDNQTGAVVITNNFISNHPLLTTSEINLLNTLSNIFNNSNGNQRIWGCWAVGVAAGALITAVTEGWGGYFAATIASVVEEDVCEAIVNSY